MGTVFALVLMMYLVTLAVLGLPLKERAQQHLDVRAESELSAITTAIQDYVLLRDYPAIEQAFATRTAHFQILSVRFSTPHVTLESRTSIQPQHYPAWFSGLIDVREPHAESEIKVGGTSYGTLAVELDAGPTIHDLWVLIVRFTLLAIGSLFGVMLYCAGCCGSIYTVCTHCGRQLARSQVEI